MSESSGSAAQQWSAESYARNARFVSEARAVKRGAQHDGLSGESGDHNFDASREKLSR